MVDLIGVPYDFGGRAVGSRLGPFALRLASVADELSGLKWNVTDRGDVVPLDSSTPSDSDVKFRYMLPMLHALKNAVGESLGRGAVPVVMGGDHSLSIGSIAAALDHYGGDLAVLWIDAHMDFNSPDTTPSGNWHGMPLGVLAGLDSLNETGEISAGRKAAIEMQWQTLRREVVGTPLTRAYWIALRDVDRGEVRNLGRVGAWRAWTMQDVDLHGLTRLLTELDADLRTAGTKALWISFDVDALDPVFAPGTGTGVRGGLNYRESHLTAELLRQLLDAPDVPYALAGVDLVEVNPLRDMNNATARVAVEWVASLFGKSIMGRRNRK